MKLKIFLGNFPVLRNLTKNFNTQAKRDEWIKCQLEQIPEGALLLDAGCGSQRYRKFCGHLQYHGQDFGAYTVEEKKQ